MSHDSLIHVQPIAVPQEPVSPVQPERPSPDAVPRVDRGAEATAPRDAPPGAPDAGRETSGEFRRGLEAVRETVDRLREQLERVREQGYLREIRMDVNVDDKLNRIVVKVLDARTEKVIREIPPEEQVAFARKLGEVLGLIFEETV